MAFIRDISCLGLVNIFPDESKLSFSKGKLIVSLELEQYISHHQEKLFPYRARDIFRDVIHTLNNTRTGND